MSTIALVLGFSVYLRRSLSAVETISFVLACNRGLVSAATEIQYLRRSLSAVETISFVLAFLICFAHTTRLRPHPLVADTQVA